MPGPIKEENLINIFRNIFSELATASDDIVKRATKDTLESWDSANHLLLITCLEEDFRTKLSDSDAVSLDSFSGAKALIEAYS